MANTLAYSDSQHTFADIFNSTFKSGEEDVLLTSIVIPKIQRDYAQGRSTLEAVRVRNKFLDALYDAVEGTPITLDFVYGNIDKNGVLTPLDGQQRLTTLFLLHWFAAKKRTYSRIRVLIFEEVFLREPASHQRFLPQVTFVCTIVLG